MDVQVLYCLIVSIIRTLFLSYGLVFLFPSYGYCFQPILVKGVISTDSNGWSGFHEDVFSLRFLDQSAALISYVPTDSKGIYYGVYGGPVVMKWDMGMDLKGRKKDGEWPIFAWDDVWYEPEIKKQYPNLFDWSGSTGPSNELMGCMLDHPLRYGDITNTGSKDLVVLLPAANGESGVDFSIFSIQKSKVIFTSELDLTDSIASADTPAHLIPKDSSDQYQYWLLSAVQEDVGANMKPAIRDYGKLFITDFDGDGVPDIVLWKKLYTSRPASDSIKGFKLVSQKLIFYKFSNGTYSYQKVDDSVIRGWLAARGLTWQQGYPNKSECPGHEGELIPEMHDPLLNDPDVLK